VHAKMALIVRKEFKKQKQYACLGTGNFNEVTAGNYADQGLLTSDKDLTSEINRVFDYLENKQAAPEFKNLLVSRFNMIPVFHKLIDKEIDKALSGKTSRIIIKVNNLEDHEMIKKLYKASQAGVKIDLIVRSICCLKPGLAGWSENITVRRIVDKFLEHSRVFIFHHDGDPLILLGSADWMERNLRKRIEIVFPVQDPKAREEILNMINIQLHDNTHATLINETGKNYFPHDHNKKPLIRSQVAYYDYLKNQ
jgi:polyphosphate kinase